MDKKRIKGILHALVFPLLLFNMILAIAGSGLLANQYEHIPLLNKLPFIIFVFNCMFIFIYYVNPVIDKLTSSIKQKSTVKKRKRK